MKFCIGCEEDKDPKFFYNRNSSRCIECTSEYQKEKRKKARESKESEGVILKLFDKLFDEKYSSFNQDLITKLGEISTKLDNLATIKKDIVDTIKEEIGNKFDDLSAIKEESDNTSNNSKKE